jgi:hypothetical protein
MLVEQSGQNVHSKVQIRASPSGASCAPHFSQADFISSATVFSG